MVCSLAALGHEATTAHVRDRAGRYLHARALAGHHASEGSSDVHGQRDPDGDTGDCALLTALHQAASAPRAHAWQAAPLGATLPTSLALAAAAPAAREIYRLAPKTSPPAAV